MGTYFRNSLIGAIIVATFLTVFGSLLLTNHAYAADDWGVLNDLKNSSAAGNTPLEKVRNAVKVTFNNAGTVHVEVSLQDPVFQIGISSVTWHDVYSGDYSWGQDPDGNWGYVLHTTALGFNLSNGDPVSSLAFIKPGGKVPGPNATAAEVSAWANKLQIYFGLFRKMGHNASDQYEYFVDSGIGHWNNYKNAISETWVTSDKGIALVNGFTDGSNNAANVTVRYIFANGAISAVVADGQSAATYAYQTSTTIKNYFKSDKDTKLLYNDGWNALTKDAVNNLFAIAGNVTVTLRKADGTKISDVLVAGSSSSAATATAAAATNIGTSDGDVNATCEVNSKTSLAWIICPIVNGALDSAAAIFRSFVQPYLETTPVSTDVSATNPIMTIWKSFRTIGNIVLVFALLIVVFGQSIGGGIVDAYTAKKTIPRILIAAILINISIYICAIVVDIFNVLGYGLVRLIISPLKNAHQLGFAPGNTDSAFAGIGLILAAVAGGALWVFLKNGPSTNGQGALGSILGYVMAFVVLPILLAMLAVFITLLLRRAIILTLIIISPVALAMFAIPGADKYAKKWLDALIKTLMVYPIITGIFGIAQVLAVVTYSAGGGDATGDKLIGGSLVALIATLIIAFAPLFMIPFAFKLAGGVIGGLASTIKGGRDNLKKMWGDDKTNPYSARVRTKDALKAGVKHRVISGAGGTNNGLLERMNSRYGNLNRTRMDTAGPIAAAAAKKDLEAARERGENFHDQDSVLGAASRTAARGAQANLTPLKYAAAAKIASDTAMRMGRERKADGTDYTAQEIATAADAAGATAIQALSENHSVETATFAANEARMAAIEGGHDADEVISIGRVAAQLHKETDGKVTKAQLKHASEATSAAHKKVKAAGGGKIKGAIVSKAAGLASGRVIGTNATPDAATIALASKTGGLVGDAVGDAHTEGMKVNTVTGEYEYEPKTRTEAEEAAAKTTFDTVVSAPPAGAPPKTDAEVLAEGKAAADKVFGSAKKP